MLARAYLALASLWRRGIIAADALFTGVWLGVLGPRTLEAVDEAIYNQRDRYHSLEHNLGGLFPWEEEAIRQHFAGAQRLLLIAAGGGREAIALARGGRSVEAYECNASLVEAAAEVIARAPNLPPLRVSLLPRGAPPPAGPRCDGAIVGWSAYMLIPGRRARLELLRGLRPRLAPGAPVLLSFFTRTADSGRLRAVARIAGALRRLRGAEPVELGDDLAPNYVHRFSAQEIRQELQEAGFELVAMALEGQGPTDSGWAVARLLPGAAPATPPLEPLAAPRSSGAPA